MRPFDDSVTVENWCAVLQIDERYRSQNWEVSASPVVEPASGRAALRVSPCLSLSNVRCDSLSVQKGLVCSNFGFDSMTVECPSDSPMRINTCETL
jgi:hypothetical protein